MSRWSLPFALFLVVSLATALWSPRPVHAGAAPFDIKKMETIVLKIAPGSIGKGLQCVCSPDNEVGWLSTFETGGTGFRTLNVFCVYPIFSSSSTGEIINIGTCDAFQIIK